MLHRTVLGIIAIVAIASNPTVVKSEGSVTATKSLDAKTVASGPSQRFSRHLKRREISTETPIETVSLNIARLLSSDQRFVRIEDLSIQYAVVDRSAFVNSFGSGASSTRRAQSRLKAVIEVELRIKIAQLSSGKLRDLDPLSSMPPYSTRLAAMFQKFGVVIVELTSERTSFRISSHPN